MERRTYTPEQKADALAVYARDGLAEAHRATGIPKPTLHRWALAAGIETAEITERSTERNRAAAQASAAVRTYDAEVFRTEMVAKLAEVARKAAAKELELIAKGDLRAVVGSRTRAIHDLQLLSGDPTARTETVAKDSLDREIERLFEHAS